MSRAAISLILVGVPLAAGCPPSSPDGGEGDAPCAICRDEKCAALVDACDDDDDCACMSTCLGAEGSRAVDACLATCELGARPAGFPALEECVALACPDDEDECGSGGVYDGPDAGAGDPNIDEIGSGALADCAFDDALAFDPDGLVLQLEDASGAVCVRVVRADLGAGNLANTSWGAVEVWLGPRGEVAHVDDPADLCWYSSHHNFLDWLHVATATRHYDLKLAWDGDGPHWYELTTFTSGPDPSTSCGITADGTGPVGAPLELLPFTP